MCACLPGRGDSGELRGFGMLDTLYEWFWWDRIWLPVNLTWADLEDREGRVYAKASHLYVTVPYAFAFLLVRYLFERWDPHLLLTPRIVQALFIHTGQVCNIQTDSDHSRKDVVCVFKAGKIYHCCFPTTYQIYKSSVNQGWTHTDFRRLYLSLQSMKKMFHSIVKCLFSLDNS